MSSRDLARWRLAFMPTGFGRNSPESCDEVRKMAGIFEPISPKKNWLAWSYSGRLSAKLSYLFIQAAFGYEGERLRESWILKGI